MSGTEELAQAEEGGEEGGEEYEGNEDDQELAAMQKELEKAEQQKAELDKLNKMQGTASADSKQSESLARATTPPLPQTTACSAVCMARMPCPSASKQMNCPLIGKLCQPDPLCTSLQFCPTSVTELY